MSEKQAVRCPTCGKRFSAPAEVLGRRVRCRACNEPFVDEPDEELELAAVVPAPAQVGMRPPPLPREAIATPKSSAWASAWARVPTDVERDSMQSMAYVIGIRLIVMGVLTLLLPLVGLQYKIVLLFK